MTEILISNMAPNPVNFHWIKTGSVKNNLLYYMQIAKVQNGNKTIVKIISYWTIKVDKTGIISYFLSTDNCLHYKAKSICIIPGLHFII